MRAILAAVVALTGLAALPMPAEAHNYYGRAPGFYRPPVYGYGYRPPPPVYYRPPPVYYRPPAFYAPRPYYPPAYYPPRPIAPGFGFGFNFR